LYFVEGEYTLPLYAYRCTQCGHKFEKIQRFSAKPEKACPECGGALERPLTAPGLKFKGSGFYVNDYSVKSSAPAAEAAPAASKSEPAAPKPQTKTMAETPCGGSCATCPAAAAAAPAK
jgi:putative FmdB family regulatory protein